MYLHGDLKDTGCYTSGLEIGVVVGEGYHYMETGKKQRKKSGFERQIVSLETINCIKVVYKFVHPSV